jgi:hypothetical protein
MIQPTGTITTEPIDAQTFDGIWIRSMHIEAPSPTKSIRVAIHIIPFNSVSGAVAPANMSKMIRVEDLAAEAAQQPKTALAMKAIFDAVQEMVTSKNIF